MFIVPLRIIEYSKCVNDVNNLISFVTFFA